MEEETPGCSFPFFNQYLKIPKRLRDRLNADHPAEYEGIPALLVHDSVIVPKRNREQVRQVMEDACREHTGFEIVVE